MTWNFYSWGVRMLDIDLIIDRMVDRRKELGWSQRDLAKKADISFEYVNKIETGHQFPSLPMLERLADALDMTVEDVFFGADLDGSMYLIPDLSERFEKWSPNSQEVFLKLLESAEEMDAALKAKRGRFVMEKR